MKSVLLALLAAGCHGDPPPSTATVALVDPGREPRREMRYAPSGGDREIRFEMPMMVFVVDWKLVGGDPPHYRFHGKDALGTDEAPASADEREVMRKVATGAQGDIAADVHGRATSASGSQSTIEELLGIAIVPWPTEPIGVGARWHVTGRAAPGTKPIDAALDYELVALDGDQAKVRWTGHNLQGATEIQKMAGEMTVRPSDLLPVGGWIDQTLPIPNLPPDKATTRITLR